MKGAARDFILQDADNTLQITRRPDFVRRSEFIASCAGLFFVHKAQRESKRPPRAVRLTAGLGGGMTIFA